MNVLSMNTPAWFPTAVTIGLLITVVIYHLLLRFACKARRNGALTEKAVEDFAGLLNAVKHYAHAMKENPDIRKSAKMFLPSAENLQSAHPKNPSFNLLVRDLREVAGLEQTGKASCSS